LLVSTEEAFEEERGLPHAFLVDPQLLRRRLRQGGGGIGDGEREELFEEVGAWREGERKGEGEGGKEGGRGKV